MIWGSLMGGGGMYNPSTGVYDIKKMVVVRFPKVITEVLF
jgi:hypothetical protein